MRYLLSMILCIWSSCAWAFPPGFIGAVTQGSSAAPTNLISYNRNDYTANTDITISGGDTFNVTCINGNYPRATDDPAVGITTSAVQYDWVLQITAYDDANPFVSIGGTVLPEYSAVGTYNGTITSGATGYIRVGANCSGSTNSSSYKLTLTLH